METSDFMISLKKKFLEEKKVAESTALAYMKTLWMLNGKKPFKNLNFLKKTDEITDRISKYAESTSRALYATALSALSLYKDKFGKYYSFYLDKVKTKSTEFREQESKHEKSDKQKENWIEWSEVIRIRDELKTEVDKFKKKIDNAEYDKLLQYVILALYTEIPPRRNKDYLDLYIVKKFKEGDDTKNYLDLTAKKLIFYTYKTSKKYGMQQVDVPESLMAIVNLYLKYHPIWKTASNRKEPVKFLVTFDGTPISTVNYITRTLNKIFKKKVSSSMLRHIYLSDRFKDDTNERQKVAAEMGHSMGQQSDYIKN